MFYQDIDGFTFEPGYEYQLTISKTGVPTAPADGPATHYQLITLVSKTPSQ
ncbi:MAG: DUF4377 domain-containing protein [Aeromonas sp.]